MEEDAGLRKLLEEHARGGRAARIERLLVMADEITPSRGSVAARATASTSTPAVSAMRSNSSIPAKPTSPRDASPSPPPVGRALRGPAAHEEVVVRLPAGEMRLRLVALS